MLAICSREIVSIPHAAELGPFQAQQPQRRHASGLPGQMHAITLPRGGQGRIHRLPLIPENRRGHVRICRWCAPAVQPGRGTCRRTWPSPCGLILRGPRAWPGRMRWWPPCRPCRRPRPGRPGRCWPAPGAGDVGARGGAGLGPQSRGPAASGRGPLCGDERAGR
jgi:hypothetical protein